MNESDSRTIRYAVAGSCGLALLLFIGWLVSHEPPPSPEPPPVRVLTASPRARNIDLLYMPDEDAPRETPTNQVAESATTNGNAAVFYRQAFAMLDALSREQKDLIKDWRTNVDASVAAELCEKIQPICDLMHQAAAVSNCDWGLEQPIRFETLLPHLNPCRGLARAAVWSVAHCRTDDPSAAIDDLVAASRVGQNASSPPMILIGHLVDLSIQGIVIDSVAEHAGLSAGAGGTRLVELFSDANYEEGLRHAFEVEANMVEREIAKLGAMQPEEAMYELVQLCDDSNPQIRSMQLAEAIADMRQVAELQRQYGQALELPEAEYRAWLTSLDEAGKTNPFVEAFVTGLEKAVDKTRAMTVRSAMTEAGLAVVQYGPNALQSHPDPSTGRSFTYTQTADGFELQSNYQVAEKPLKLSFK